MKMKIKNVIVTIAILFICGINIFLFNQHYLKEYKHIISKKDDDEDHLVPVVAVSPRSNNRTIKYNINTAMTQEEKTSVKLQSKVISKSNHNSFAMDIVRKSFNETYATLIEICPNKKDESIMKCLKTMYDIIKSKDVLLSTQDIQNQNNNNDDDVNVNVTEGKSTSEIRTWPNLKNNGQHWWFQSMLRDAAVLHNVKPQGVQGSWHIGQAKDPNVSMCIMEKVGTKQWRKLFTTLNGGDKFKFRSDVNKVIQLPDDENKSQQGQMILKDIGSQNITDLHHHDLSNTFNDNSTSNEYYPSFIFLRDPLDRFLSAYLDKCVDKSHRIHEKHCEPNEVYNLSSNNKHNQMLAGFSFEDDEQQLNQEKEKLQGKGQEQSQHHQHHVNKRAMFAAYVDTMPLKWNLHFFPQSLYCNGLYRFIDMYDFVGHMDHLFYSNLDILGKRYGGRFEIVLDEVFHYKSNDNLKTRNNTGVETKAADKVQQFYTPRTLRRVLEYVSIDYVMLDLKIPDWAEDMLREDENMR